MTCAVALVFAAVVRPFLEYSAAAFLKFGMGWAARDSGAASAFQAPDSGAALAQ